MRIKKDLAPVCIVKISTIGGIQIGKPLLCLLDLGSTTANDTMESVTIRMCPNEISAENDNDNGKWHI